MSRSKTGALLVVLFLLTVAAALLFRPAWLFPAFAILLFAAVTATNYKFEVSIGGWLFAAALLVS